MDGNLFLSYVTVSESGGSVHLRRLGDEDGSGMDAEAQGKDLLVSAGCADAYDAVLTADSEGDIWVFYTGLAESGRYDIFARHFDEETGLSESGGVTFSRDDAMHPAATVDADGNVWLAYFLWLKMGIISRDKEIYSRVFDGEAWSSENRLSPVDVPDYEDHTDPAVAPDPEGGVSVAWSWDMHPMRDEKYARYQSEYGAESPTIFGRRVSTGSGAQDLLFFGAAGFDGAPELCRASDQKLWCAWSALHFFGPSPSRSLHASVSSAGESDRSAQFVIEKGVRDVCTPRFFEHDGLNMIWSSCDQKGCWSLKASAFSEEGWSFPVVIEGEGNPRFPDVAVGKDGCVWIAYSRDSGQGTEIAGRILEL
jgi:hypothetical protein